jgi:osmotically-inducible protein OsmY
MAWGVLSGALEVSMTTTTLTDNDLRTRDAVAHELEADPRFDASAIGVSATRGAVTLSGFVDTYAAKLAAERAAKRVRGVRAVANEVQVRLRLAHADDEIARDAARALELRSTVPVGVQAVVHAAHVTLTGRVGWHFQREAAENAVRYIPGVLEVLNHVEVVPATSSKDVRRHITESLHRHADVNAKQVEVTVSGSVATLSGHVSSWTERLAIERAAADAPGISRVDNRLEVNGTPL